MFGFSVRSDLLAGAGVDLVGAGAGGLTPGCASGSGTGSATGGPTTSSPSQSRPGQAASFSAGHVTTQGKSAVQSN